ncbi:hypothetical protein [Paenibacillus sp. NPDC058071]|uniref:hypothetical protein n=1 Tax=Paenibacillus sp. NPDC058071 TaxID=3346326 RepID=UPI0036DA9825
MRKRMIAWLVVLFAALSFLTACSSEAPDNQEEVEVQLQTEPETVIAGNTTELRALITGMDVPKDATVTFDIRVNNQYKLVDAVNEGKGEFSGAFIFPEKGKQTVYVHFYVNDIHLTKKKWVEVQ